MNSICQSIQPTPLKAKHHMSTNSNAAKVLHQSIILLITHGFLFTSQIIKCKLNSSMHSPSLHHRLGKDIRGLYDLSHMDLLDPT